MRFASCAVMMPFLASIAAWALLAAMSCRYRWRSKSIEALISSMIGSGSGPKRPPHILLLMMRSLPRFVPLNDRAVRAAAVRQDRAAAALIGRCGLSPSWPLPCWRGYTGLGVCEAIRPMPPAAGGQDRRRGSRRWRMARSRRSRWRKRPFRVPDLAFKDAEGHDHTLADWRGRTVLLNLWATWCVPCRREMPALDALQAKLGGTEFRGRRRQYRHPRSGKAAGLPQRRRRHAPRLLFRPERASLSRI